MSLSNSEKNIKILEFLKTLNQLHWFSKLNYSQNPNLLEILNNLANNENYNLELRVGASIEEKPINIRYLTYFLPCLELLALFNRGQKEGLFSGIISLRIIINHNLGKQIDQQISNFESYFKRNKNLIRDFIRSYYPKIIRLIKIDIDNFDYKILDEDKIITDSLKNKLKSDKIFQKLISFSQKRNTEDAHEKALKYALGHTILFGDFVHNDSENKTNVIITIGGPAEKYFNHFRNLISESLEIENHHKPLQVRLIQNNGSHPPYYSYPNDIPIIELLTGNVEEIMENQLTNFGTDFEVITKSITTKNKLESYLYFLKQFLQTNS